MSFDGTYRTLKVPAYYVPTDRTRILSLGTLMGCHPGIEIMHKGGTLTISGAVEGEPTISVPYDEVTHLPYKSNVMDADAPAQPENGWKEATKKSKKKKSSEPQHKLPKGLGGNLLHQGNYNLSKAEKELLRWHYRLGHVGIKQIQWLFRQGVLSSSKRTRRIQDNASKLTGGPLCTACQYAKQQRKTSPGSTKKTTKHEEGKLKQNQLFPGQCVSMDHFMCSAKGRCPHTYGKESPDLMYNGGCIFVDNATGFIEVAMQQHLNSHETLRDKEAFQARCHDHGVIVQAYHADNRIFRGAEFMANLEEYHQTIRFTGTGAHHSNGIAKRAISTVMSIASRAMLHHSALLCPDVADPALWPMAVDHAVYILNRIPQEDSGQSPLELFTRTTWPRTKLNDLHVWGCPIYVLDPKEADGKSVPKWLARGSRHMYMGSGEMRLQSSAIPQVLSLEAGKITGKFHVVFDDWFNTVNTAENKLPNFEHNHWYNTFGATEWQYVKDNENNPDDHQQAPPGLVAQERAELTQEQIVRSNSSPRSPSVVTQPLQPLNQRELPKLAPSSTVALPIAPPSPTPHKTPATGANTQTRVRAAPFSKAAPGHPNPTRKPQLCLRGR